MNDDARARGPRRAGITRIFEELLTASRFAVVGSAATLVHMGVVWLLLEVYAVQVFRGNFVAFLCASVFSFAGHHLWTFEGSAPVRRRFVRFALIASVAFLSNSIVLAGILRTGSFSPAVSALVAVAAIPALTFVASRVWGFRQS